MGISTLSGGERFMQGQPGFGLSAVWPSACGRTKPRNDHRSFRVLARPPFDSRRQLTLADAVERYLAHEESRVRDDPWNQKKTALDADLTLAIL
jgi:hypothetical protein